MSLLTKSVTTLSELGIDVNKDWGGHRIENIGAPDSQNDVPRARAGDILEGRFSTPQMPDGPDGQYMRGGGAGLDPAYSAIPADDLPDLDASRITSGRFPASRLPAMADNKIWKGTGGDVEEVDLPSLPSGMITMWSGATASIPAGWQLCDGTNGTPDLRDRFIVGAGNEYGVGNTGGEKEHALAAAEMPSHSHAYGCAVVVAAGGDMAGYNRREGAEDGHRTTFSAGGNQAHENRPPFYALCFIMKL